MISSEYIATAIDAMKKNGVSFTDGLSKDELTSIERLVGGNLPKDLSALLSIAVPLSMNGDSSVFPNWKSDAKSVTDKSYAFIESLFESDVVDGDYWDDSWGKRPLDSKTSAEIALKELQQLPRLIPVFKHRYVIAGIESSPVLSYHGPLETIIYGDNLPDYLSKEFGVQAPEEELRPVDNTSFWTRIS